VVTIYSGESVGRRCIHSKEDEMHASRTFRRTSIIDNFYHSKTYGDINSVSIARLRRCRRELEASGQSMSSLVKLNNSSIIEQMPTKSAGTSFNGLELIRAYSKKSVVFSNSSLAKTPSNKAVLLSVCIEACNTRQFEKVSHNGSINIPHGQGGKHEVSIVSLNG